MSVNGTRCDDPACKTCGTGVVGRMFYVVKLFEGKFALKGPDDHVWDVGWNEFGPLKTKGFELQRAFDLGREHERQLMPEAGK